MSIPDRIAVLFANDSFYAAFANRDYRAMASLWSAAHPVTCTHPGWSTLIGRDQVMESWQAILASPTAPAITCHNAEAFLFGDVAYVLCYERLDRGFLAATNVFIREGGGWRLLHHQAGSAPAPAEREEPAPKVQ